MYYSILVKYSYDIKCMREVGQQIDTMWYIIFPLLYQLKELLLLNLKETRRSTLKVCSVDFVPLV